MAAPLTFPPFSPSPLADSPAFFHTVSLAGEALEPEPRQRAARFFALVALLDALMDTARSTATNRLACLKAIQAACDGLTAGDDLPLALRQAIAGDMLLRQHAGPMMQVRIHHLELARRTGSAGDAALATAPFPTWSDLHHFSRFTVAPAARYLLALHGESERHADQLEALLLAAMLIGQLQDGPRVLRDSGRLVLPLQWLTRAGAVAEDLLEPRAPARLRTAYATGTGRAGDLLSATAALPDGLADPGLRRMTRRVWRLADRLRRRLERRDPLRAAVAPGWTDRLVCRLTR